MNKRINEEFLYVNVLAPKSVEASTPAESKRLDVADAMEVEFVASTAALGAGKSLKVELLGAAGADDAGEVIATAEFTDETGTDPTVAAVSYRPTAFHGGYVFVRISHDADAAVMCGVTAAIRVRELPAPNAWTLNA